MTQKFDPSLYYENQALIHNDNLKATNQNEREAQLLDTNPYSQASGQQLVDRYRGEGAGAQYRQSVKVDNSRVNGLANTMGDGGNAALRAAVQRYASSAGPSAAGSQGSVANNSALSSMLHARAGGGSLVGALTAGGQSALANGSAAGSTMAQEVANRQAQSLGGYSALRGNDQALAGTNAKMAGIQYGMADAQTKSDLQQQALNDQYRQQMEQNAFNVRAGQLQQGIQDSQRAAGINSTDNAFHNADINRTFQYFGAGANAAGSAAAAGANYSGGGSSGGGSNYTSNGGTNSNSLLNDTIVGNGTSDERAKNREPTAVDRDELKAALSAEDDRKSSVRAGVSPRDLNPGGAKPQLLTEVIQSRNEYPSLASAIGPDKGVLADANRKMAGEPYTYKGAFVPQDEKPGQLHYGFMAQNLEKNPVTATAVQERPDGAKEVHGMRMLQAVASGVSDLQRQLDEMRGSK